jgi:peptidylprolyl isomerase
MLFRTLAALTAVFALSGAPALAQGADPENMLVMELESGTVTIALRPDIAPKHAERLKTLARQGFYDGVVFHRVIEGFMAQTGDPTGTGMGGSDLPDLAAEFSDVPFTRGVVGMARSQDPNSANSQFFITYADAPSSTASTPWSARWWRAWTPSTRSRRARRPTTAWSRTRTASSA